MNSYGKLFRITTFGESHGTGIGVVIDGCPAGLPIDTAFIQSELDRRKPGQSRITTQRREKDEFQVLSGVFEGKAQGTPIALLILNEDQRSKDYAHIADQFRPSHADYTYQAKYGSRDYRGGGRSSARETAARVAAGAVAKLLLRQIGVTVQAYVSQVGPLKLETPYAELNLPQAEDNAVRCPDPDMAARMFEFIDQTRKKGDSVGGRGNGRSDRHAGRPRGAGVRQTARRTGQGHAEHQRREGLRIRQRLCRRRKVRLRAQRPVLHRRDGPRTHPDQLFGGHPGRHFQRRRHFFPRGLQARGHHHAGPGEHQRKGEGITVEGKGRHDPCVVPRAVPIVEAMTALVLADFYLRNKVVKI
jgi:chorismate synthase